MVKNRLPGDVWIGTATKHVYWAEGALGHVYVEKSDEDEVAVHFMVSNDETADASIYLDRHTATQLMVHLGHAIGRGE